VPDYDFMFAVDLSSDSRYDRMISELVTSVLGYIGYDGSAIALVARDVCGAVAGAVNAGGRWELRFRAAGGELNVSIVHGGIADWQITRRLPARS
jgi:hypothetical protein